MDAVVTRRDLREELDRTLELYATKEDLRVATNVIIEAFRTHLGALDDKLSATLERKVFAPRKRRRARRARRPRSAS